MDYEDIFRLLTRKKSLFRVSLGPVSYESSKPAYSQGVPVECRAYIPESDPCGQPSLQTQLVTDLLLSRMPWVNTGSGNVSPVPALYLAEACSIFGYTIPSCVPEEQP